MKKQKRTKGFTLIELLAVVLLIAILCAVALPKYQKAVLKFKMGQVMSLVRSLASSQEEYFLANKQYADSFNKLSVNIPGTEHSRANEVYKQYEDWEIVMYCPSKSCDSIEASYGAKNSDYMVKIAHYLIHKRGTNKFRNAANLICIAGVGTANKKKGGEVCKSLGGKLIDKSNDRYYKLPF